MMLVPLNKMLYNDILADIETIRNNAILWDERTCSLRLQAIDDIEFDVIDRLDALMESEDEADWMHLLKQQAKTLKGDLENVNAMLFNKLRMEIVAGGHRGERLMDLLNKHFDDKLDALFEQNIAGYDELDIFLNKLLTNGDVPAETKDREIEMVYYQKTPARIVLELVKKAHFKPQDVFFDLGSGLGQVAILVNLLTSVVSKGVEFEPAFCSYAENCAYGLNLTDVDFINTDARYTDYSVGTVFFMYTPFKGKMLGDVLQKLYKEAKTRSIKIFTYGPCTQQVAQQSWLVNPYQNENLPDKLGEFYSL